MILFEKETWTLRIVTPLHIGGGDYHQLSKMEIAIRGNQLLVLDQKKWAGLLMDKGLFDEFLAFAQASGQSARPAERGERPKKVGSSLTDWLYEKKLWDQARQCVAYQLPFPDQNPANQLHPFIKNSDGQPYIPGSSLKGVIRTALLHKLLREFSALRNPIREQLDRALRGLESRDWQDKKAAGREIKRINLNRLLHGIEGAGNDALRDIMRIVRVSDSQALGQPGANLIVCKKTDFNLQKDTDASHPRRFNPGQRPIVAPPLFRESLRTDTGATFALTLDKGLLRSCRQCPFDNLSGLFAILTEYGHLLYDWLAQDFCRDFPDLLPRAQTEPPRQQNASPEPRRTAMAAAFAKAGIRASQDIVDKPALATLGPNLNLGGGTGFQTKVLLQAIYWNDKEGYTRAARILLENQFGKPRSRDQFVPRTIKLDRSRAQGGKMMGWCHFSR